MFRWLSVLLLGLYLSPSHALSCPRYNDPKPIPINPEYGLYDASISFTPSCQDKPETKGCSKGAPSLRIKGSFVDMSERLDDLDRLLNNKPVTDKQAALWVGVSISGETKMRRFQVKVGETLGGGSGSVFVKGTLTLNESANFVFSSNGEQTKTLELSLLNAEGQPIRKSRFIRPDTKSFAAWNPPAQEHRPPCNKNRALPYNDNALPMPIPQELPKLGFDPVAPSLPVIPEVPAFSLEQWLAAHQGQLLACQLSTLLLLGVALLLRRVRSAWRLMLYTLLGSAALSALVFWGVARSMPTYASDIAAAFPGDWYPLTLGPWFGLMLGSLLSLWLTGRLLSQQHPSLDLTERLLFRAAGWLSLGALAAQQWAENLLLSGVIFLVAALSLCVCLWMSRRRMKWLERVKAGELFNLSLLVAPLKEHPSDKILAPVFYHPKYDEFCDQVVLRVSAESDPYRRQQEPLWLTSSSVHEQSRASLRITACILLLGFIGLLVVGLAIPTY